MHGGTFILTYNRTIFWYERAPRHMAVFVDAAVAVVIEFR